VRTTLEIADNVLQAAKEIAKHKGSSAGKVLSDLARQALQARAVKKATIRNGVPVFAATGEPVTLEKAQQLADEEGV
jgi:predicted transcriptional regulator